MTGVGRASDPSALERFFGSSDLLPLWIAEPYVPLAEPIVEALRKRAADGWYGYESRPDEVYDAFWAWMNRRHGWDGSGLTTSVSPSVGTSIGIIIDHFTEPGDGVILQPPVFTDFKPLIRRLERVPVRNSLILDSGRYTIDFDDLAEMAADPKTKVMILCSPHNPVGRVWSEEELESVSRICAANGVFVIADEIHADLVLPPHEFTPFARVPGGAKWASTQGAIKTFGLAGVADTLLISDDEDLSRSFRAMTDRFHMTRNNVFSLAATHAGYTSGDEWLDEFLELVTRNHRLLEGGLGESVDVVAAEGTYLAWVDFRKLGLDVPELAEWLVSKARLALSPGHWFGREGAGFARLTVATQPSVIEEAVERINAASQ